MTSFSSLVRNRILEEMSSQTYDVLIIGGGITGAGIALDAVSRGMKTALIEMQDFAAGTSSRSTKLVHGGLRYLKQFEFKLVAEVGRERAVVYENAPHVTTPEWMLLPLIEGGSYGYLMTAIGLTVYDLLAGVKKKERRQMLGKAETLHREPLLRADKLKGSGYYVEYRTDDARLTIETMKEAVKRGVNAINYTKADRLLYEGGILTGVHAVDQISGKAYELRAAKIVNAAGPWVDTLREIDGSKKGKRIHLTKGIHLVVDGGRFPLQQAVYFDTPDGRMVFAIPRDSKTYIGTTDTDYAGEIASPRVSEADRDYILAAANYMFPSIKLTPQDVESSWAGLRPLIHEEGKGPSELSRKDEIFISDSGLISIAGGKLTGYRKMAERVVDLIARQFALETGRSFSACQTDAIKLSGGNVGGSKHFADYVREQAEAGVNAGLTGLAGVRLARRYGSNAGRLFDLVRHRAREAAEYGMPLDVFAQLAYAIEEEMAMTPVDFFVRRTGSLLFDIDWVRKWQGPAIHYMANRFGWTDADAAAYRAQLQEQLRDAVVPTGA